MVFGAGSKKRPQPQPQEEDGAGTARTNDEAAADRDDGSPAEQEAGQAGKDKPAAAKDAKDDDAKSQTSYKSHKSHKSHKSGASRHGNGGGTSSPPGVDRGPADDRSVGSVPDDVLETKRKPGLLGFVMNLRSQARNEVKKRKEKLESQFFKYGPPYRDDYGGNLYEECCQAGASWMDVHQLLLEGGDPRTPEPDALSTPLHEVARHCRLDLAKILVKAGAKLDQPNALGITALNTLCMCLRPEAMHEKFMAMLEWMIQKGADVNHRDRAGHSALEFTANRGDMDAVKMLLNAGATVTRTTEFISFAMPTALDVPPPNFEVHRLLALTAAKERNEREQRDSIRKAEQRRLQIAEERQRYFEQKKLDRERERVEGLRHDADLRRRKEERKAKAEIRRQRKINKARKDAAHMGLTVDAPGTWKRLNKMTWERQPLKHLDRSQLAAEADALVNEAVELGADKQFQRAKRKLNSKWHDLTGNDIANPALKNFAQPPPDTARKENRPVNHVAAAAAVHRRHPTDGASASKAQACGNASTHDNPHRDDSKTERKAKKHKSKSKKRHKPPELTAIKEPKAIEARFTPLSPVGRGQPL